MLLFDRDYRIQKKKARIAFREYKRNGWQSSWIRKNSLLDVLRR